MVDKGRLVRLTQSLIRINSENPPGNESRIAMLVKKELEEVGLKAKLYKFAKNRPNVVGILKGEKSTRLRQRLRRVVRRSFSEGGQKSLLLTAHLDTVPAGKGWKFPPFGGRIYKGKIYGLGATDCKGNLAAGLEAIRSISESKSRLNFDLIFAATADEEAGSNFGLIPLLEKGVLEPDCALILDSDSFHIIVAQKGLIHFKVKIFGKRAHGAYPWRGVNAIELASKIIQRLKKYKFRYRAHPLLRAPTINIGTIKGGDKVNIVADWCEFEVDLRFLPGMEVEEILRGIKKELSRATKNFKIEIDSVQKPYTIDQNHPLVHTLINAIKKTNLKPKIKGSEGATVITFFQDKNIPAIATGFGSTGCAHTKDEYVKIDDLYRGTKALVEFLSHTS